MNSAMEYIRRDPEFSEIYDNSVELQDLKNICETTSDIEIVKEYTRRLVAQSTRLVCFLMQLNEKNNTKLLKIVEEAQEQSKRSLKQRNDMVCLLAESMEVTPMEFLEVYKEVQRETEMEPIEKVTRHLKLIK